MTLWPDASLRSAEISKIATRFENQGFVETAKALKDVAMILETSQERSAPADALKKTIDIPRTEFADKDSKLSEMFDFVSNCIGAAVLRDQKQFHKRLLQAYPLIEKFGKKIAMMSTFAKPLLEMQTTSKKWWFLCKAILYGWNYEGVFDESVRLVYILTCLAQGKNIRYRECEWIPARDLRDSLSKLTKGNSEIIFAGFDPHMRNSIFHFSFDYDDSLQRIHLEDYDHRRKNVVKTDITLAEFDRKYKYLDAVNNMIMNIFFILKAKDLIQAKDPWA